MHTFRSDVTSASASTFPFARRVLRLILFIFSYLLGSVVAYAVAPTISTQPQSQTVTAGGTATFTVIAAGPPAPSYQWRKNGTNISGATASTYSKTNVQTSDVGDYTVYVSNNHGNLTSNVAILTVNVAPAITTQPQGQTVTAGGSANFSVVATGSPTPAYQWKKDGTNISGATNSSYSNSNVQSGDAGSYTVFVSNSAGSVTSSAAALTVNFAPTISTHPQNQTVAAGGTANFSVSASGNPTPTYQWRKDGSNISGATNGSYSRSNVQSGDMGSYTVVVSNSVDSITSNVASLTVTGGTLLTPNTGAIAGGNRHTMLLKSDGTVWAAGANYFGQLGDGTITPRANPVQTGGLTGVVAVAAGAEYTMALKSDGTVWGWGDNAGELQGFGSNVGTTDYRTIPVAVIGVNNVVEITARYAHTIALKGDGTVYGWGDNYYGQLGDGTSQNVRNIPTAVSGLTSIISVSAGWSHTLALRSDGTVWGFGSNSSGELGDGTTNQRNIPVQVTGLSGVVAVSAGARHSLALKGDGTVWKWGADGIVALTSPVQVEGISNVTSLDTGYHSLALKSDGSVWTWGKFYIVTLGDNPSIDIPTPVQVTGVGNNVVAIMASNASAALTNDGRVWSWGDNREGQFGDGSSLMHLLPVQVRLDGDIVAAGVYHNAAVKADGTIRTWGSNAFGELGDGTSTSRITPGSVVGLTGMISTAVGSIHTIALKSDGTVYAWGYNGNGAVGDGTATDRNVPVLVGGLANIIAVTAGESHSAALKSDGTVFTWGANWYGQLGDGTTTTRIAPVLVSGLTGVVKIAAYKDTTFAVKGDGTAWAWGANYAGQLGDGTTTQRVAPVQVPGLGNVAVIMAGASHTIAAKIDGTVWAWGSNVSGELGDGTTIQRLTPVQVNGLTNVISTGAGHFVSMALKGDGTLWTWGDGYWPLLGHGSFASQTVPGRVMALDAVTRSTYGRYHTLASKADGTVWTWGYSRGQMGFSSFGPSQMAIRLTADGADSDQDGLLDAWEIQKFGNLSHNGATDGDGDGLTDIQEFTKGSDPMQANADGDLYNDFADTHPNDPYDGQTPTLNIIGGNNQSAPPSTFNLQPFDVAVWNTAGTQPLIGAPIQFAVTQGGGSLATTNIGTPTLFTSGTLLTDIDGTAQVFYKQPGTAGVQSQVTVTAGPATPVLFQTTSVSNVPDSDGDGILDAWEIQYFGNLTQTGNGDPDGDGLTNLQEYQLGRNPTKGALLDTAGVVNLRLYAPSH